TFSGSTVTLTGALANVNAALANNNITYTRSEERRVGNTLSINASSSEDGITFSTATSRSADGVAETPSLASLAAQSTNENTAVGLTGLSTVTSHDPGTSDDSDTFKVTLSVANGSLSVATHTNLGGTFSGSTVTLTGALSDVNAALANNNITYTPTHD